MKIALGQLNLTIGDISENIKHTKEYINKAVAAGAGLIVLPQETTTVKDADGLLFDVNYKKQAESFFSELLELSRKIDIVVGAVEWADTECYNAAYLLRNGQPYSTSNTQGFSVDGCKFIVCLGEEEELLKNNVDYVIKMHSAPFVKQSDTPKQQPISGIGTIYINHVGLSEEGVYAGESFVADRNGNYFGIASSLKPELLIVDTLSTERVERKDIQNEAEMFNTLSFAMKEFCRINRFEKALLGLSGGIDSALTAAILCDALGAENVLGVTMPSKYSTEGSWNDSYDLAKNLNMECRTIPIKPLFETFVNDIQDKQYSDLAEENLQSRLRGNILMTISNRENRVLLSTGNKSEAAMGYCTLYGDTAGGINLLADLYKQEVYALSRYVNRNKEIIPENTITKPPSAELRPDQKDCDSLPDYAILDDILWRYVEGEQTIDEISEHYDRELVVDVVNKTNRMEFKRRQFTYCVNLSKKPLGRRKFPLVSRYRV